MGIRTSDEVLKHVKGLGLNPDLCQRVIIDIQRGRLVEVHAFLMGNDSVDDVIKAIATADLKVIPNGNDS